MSSRHNIIPKQHNAPLRRKLIKTSATGTRIQHIYETTINYPNNRSQSLGDLSSVDKILMKYFDWAHMDSVDAVIGSPIACAPLPSYTYRRIKLLN